MKKPDNIVYTESNGYNASVLPYGTNLGAPAIKTDDVVAWKTRGIHQANKEFETRYNELKQQYQNLMDEFRWNEIVYNAKFSFEPVVGQLYHLYRGADEVVFLSLIGPDEWNREYLGTSRLNSDKKWIKI